VRLKPSYDPVETKFNYRRVILPPEIYRDAYNADNRHLPTRQTMEQYDQWFLQAVARNDINATRAFLNSGRSVNIINAEGDSALIVAIRYRAFDVARLLVARGANPMQPGKYGWSAVDYARAAGVPYIFNEG
jgi:ankyrin repeat protein